MFILILKFLKFEPQFFLNYYFFNEKKKNYATFDSIWIMRNIDTKIQKEIQFEKCYNMSEKY